MQPSQRQASVLRQTRRALGSTSGPLVLAVSGGCDSMVLLRAVVATFRSRVAVVATFDHGTGASARAAVALVRAECATLGVPVVAGGGKPVRRSESAWREARWTFLRRVAREHGAQVVTAHSRDDHVETVLIRVLRGSGARGLTGLHGGGAVVRPFLALDRTAIRAFALDAGVRFADDPTNESRRYLRNRIRLDLLPALRTVHPDIDGTLLALSLKAFGVRRQLDALAEALSTTADGARLSVAACSLAAYSRESLGALWPAIAARAGVILDRRGTERIVSFTIDGRVGARIQLSGGWEVHRSRDRFELRRTLGNQLMELSLDYAGEVRLGAWRFVPGADRPGDPWTAVLPADAQNVVRPWRSGDRMAVTGQGPARRVKRFLSDARVTAPDRSRWPVVVSNGEVVWIPGVRRGSAAAARPGRPEASYECEFDDRG